MTDRETMENPITSDRRLDRGVMFAAVVTAGIGLLALGTWASDFWRITALGPKYVPMAPSTAALFVLLGLALGAMHRWPGARMVRFLGAVFASVALMVSALVAVQAWKYFPLPWDRWLTRPGLRLEAIPLGRMSPLTAAAFWLSAVSLLTQLPLPSVSRVRRATATIAAGVAVLGALVVLLGYASGAPLYYAGEMVPMALSTAGVFLVLNVGLLLANGTWADLRDWWTIGVDSKVMEAQRNFTSRILIVAAGVLAIIILTGILYQRHQQDKVRENVYGNLGAVADLKVEQIVNWRLERLSDGQFLVQAPHVARSVAAFFARPDDPGARAEMMRWLDLAKSSDRYESVMLFDAAGIMRLATPGSAAEPGADERSLAAGALRGGEPTLDMLRLDATGRVYLDLLVPVLSPGVRTDGNGPAPGPPIAVMVLHLDPEKFLFPLVQSWPTASPSAETLLVRRDGDQVVFLNELRHRGRTVLVMRRPANNPNLPAAAAVSGAARVIEGTDYRGVPVLAATRPIPGSPWFMVAKIDTQEAFAPIREEVWRTGTMVGLLLMAVALAAAFLWRLEHANLLRRELVLEREHKGLAERLAAVTQHANDIILLLDESGRITEANERAMAAYGYTLDELRRLPPGGLRPPGGGAGTVQQLAQLASPDGAVFETIQMRKDGTTFPVEIRGRGVEVGGRWYSLTIIRDIGERKRVEAEIRQLNAELEERVVERTAELEASNRELEAFSYSVSHDLRAPLRSIDGFSRILLEDYAARLDDEGRDHLERICAATQRMARLIDDLLNLSRLNRAEMRREQVDLSAVARTVAAELQAQEPGRPARLRIASGVSARGDAQLLRVVLENLLGNAWKFSAKRPEANIEFGANRDNGQTSYFVRDHGAGFDPAYAGRLFGAFQRLHSSEEFPGTGIGLANVQRIVRRHGGRVWAEGEVNKGATFFFTLGTPGPSASPFTDLPAQ